MKKLTTIIFLLLVIISFSQTTNVPDNNFEQTLIDLGLDDVIDGVVLTENINMLTNLDLHNKNISDLTGIEDFISLTSLNIYNNQLTNFDISTIASLNTLYCGSNPLTSLDLSANTALTVLICPQNQLTSLDLSTNVALTNLTCYMNQLTSLDVSANTALTFLACSENQLTSLDVSANTALTYLDCAQNQLTSINVSANTLLTNLYVFLNSLTSIDISANTALTDFWCAYNSITSLDVTANTLLNVLYCSSNQLTSLDITSNTSLTYMYCNLNQLTSLDVRNGNNSSLIDFNCLDNPNLSCVFCDDADWSETNWVNIDVNSTFVETETACDALKINKIEQSNFSIYPNPTKEDFSINTERNIKTIKIYDVFGKHLKTYNSQENYSVSDLKSGIYLIHLESVNGVFVTKLIIE